MKSYGRAPTFLMATGYEQVRSIAAALAGNRAAADDVRLVLPETGVCSTDLGGSCDLPAPGVEELGCCAPAVTEEPVDACCSEPQPVTIGAAPVSVRSSCC